MVIAVNKSSNSKEEISMNLLTHKAISTVQCNSSKQFKLSASDEINSLVNTINFDKLKWKLTKSTEATWTQAICEFAELEYKKFLTLKMLYPKVSFVPSKLVDKFWHEHILDTKSYAEDCKKLFGSFVHHYPYFGIYGDEDQKALQTAFEETIKLYESHFGSYPTDELFGQKSTEAARCGDHACHVPSSCRCRVPGACN